MNLTTEQLNEILQRPAIAKRNQVGSEEKTPQPQCAVRNEPVAEKTGEAPNTGRFRVCIEGRRVRLIDPDNLCGKYFLDCCRYAGLIPQDTAAVIDYSISQTKVKTKEEELTVITITPL